MFMIGLEISDSTVSSRKTSNHVYLQKITVPIVSESYCNTLWADSFDLKLLYVVIVVGYMSRV